MLLHLDLWPRQGLLKTFPDAARVWIGIGGAIGGAILIGGLGLSVVGLFWKGWDSFGIAIWVGLALTPIGGILGFWVVGATDRTA